MEMHSAQYSYSTRASKARASPQSGWLMRLFTALLEVILAVQAELRACRAYAELASLDDRMLRDIGVSRSEIRSLVWRSVVSGQATQLGWRRRRNEHGSN